MAITLAVDGNHFWNALYVGSKGSIVMDIVLSVFLSRTKSTKFTKFANILQLCGLSGLCARESSQPHLLPLL